MLLLSRARPEERGAVLGLNTCVTYLGASLGTAVAGTLYTMPALARWPWPPAAPSRSPRWDCTGAKGNAAARAQGSTEARASAKAPVSRPAPSSGAFSSRSAMLPLRGLRDIAAPITIKEDRVTATTPLPSTPD